VSEGAAAARGLHPPLTQSDGLAPRLLSTGACSCEDRGVGPAGAFLLVAGVVIVFANVVATRRLWTSAIFETSQKVAQTVLMWLVPGSVIVVWNVLREPRIGDQPDPTAGTGAAFVVTDWLLGAARYSGHHGGAGEHHGSEGGQDSAGDGGAHHHGGDGGDGGHGGGFDGGAGGSP